MSMKRRRRPAASVITTSTLGALSLCVLANVDFHSLLTGSVGAGQQIELRPAGHPGRGAGPRRDRILWPGDLLLDVPKDYQGSFVVTKCPQGARKRLTGGSTRQPERS